MILRTLIYDHMKRKKKKNHQSLLKPTENLESASWDRNILGGALRRSKLQLGKPYIRRRGQISTIIKRRETRKKRNREIPKHPKKDRVEGNLLHMQAQKQVFMMLYSMALLFPSSSLISVISLSTFHLISNIVLITEQTSYAKF